MHKQFIELKLSFYKINGSKPIYYSFLQVKSDWEILIAYILLYLLTRTTKQIILCTFNNSTKTYYNIIVEGMCSGH